MTRLRTLLAPSALLPSLLPSLLWALPALAQAPAAPSGEAPAAPAEAPAGADPADPGSNPPPNPPAEAPAEPPAAAEAPAATPADPPADSGPVEAAEGPGVDRAEARIEPRPLGDDDIHLTMRWGMRVHLDPAYAALGDDMNHFAAEIGLDVRVWQQLAVGFSFTGGGEIGELYGAETRWQDNSIFLSAVYRQRLPGLGLSLYGRLGPTVHWYRMVIGEQLYADDGFDDAAWQFGARAAAGLEFWPVSPEFIAYMGRFGIGLVLEAYYDQAFHSTWSSGGVDPGPFDPSGPGWSLGLTGRF